MTGKLSIVATPIGNLGDISPRAVTALESADCVCAEDTRVTGKLLAALGVKARLERCDENVIARKTPELMERMRAGEHVAFCSDAGMPGISDPGAVLVDACRNADLPVEVLPGPSAVTTAVASAGFTGTAFYFGGFLPRKHHARTKALQTLAGLEASLVFYESPHRTLQAVRDMVEVFGERRIALCRELTKLHEEVVRLPARDLLGVLERRETLKGEIVLVVEPPHAERTARRGTGQIENDSELQERVREGLAAGERKSTLAKALASEFGVPKNAVYEMIHTWQMH